MRIVDTLTARDMEMKFGDCVRIYLCGVTVYDEAHVGHARTIIAFDVLRRYLESTGRTVDLVQNFTDVDDKIISRARMEERTAAEISQRYMKNYHRDFDALNVARARTYPKATEHIGDMIRLIDGLVQKGMAYTSTNGVYFAVSKFAGYGRLSKKRTGDLLAGARVEVDEDKRDPLDFALWKFAAGEPAWDSPWGRGRPGWHIECSAMSVKYLGADFDIHGGGRDLIFPHHENEIAQSEGYSGGRFARAWMHVGMVTINGDKMSKSMNNIKTVRHVLENWSANTVRLFCLSGHYSKPIDYTDALLKESLIRWRQAEAAWHELIQAHAGDAGDAGQVARECRREFVRALEEDFNTHEALSAFFKMVKEVNRLASDGQMTQGIADAIRPEMERCMGILGLAMPDMSREYIESVNEMIRQRREMRQAGRYDEADSIRDRISEMGIELLDHKSGTSWIRKEPVKAEQ